ncbi:MAG TPA: AraC family transcriptional regulator [Cytophagales bacterium]|nr:AraC family transcriptional regulator [Cytophagales bacterium]HAP58021.1 AraC family transcriptional regulator [Cytophagales bacterium]
MSTPEILLAIILSIGCAQGLLFGLLLLQTREQQPANRWLGILLLLFSYRLLNQTLLLFDIGQYDLWYHLTLELSWAYGPLLYLYVRSKAQPQRVPQRVSLWLFLPVLIQVVCSVFVRSQNFYWDGTRDSLSGLGYWAYQVWRNYPVVPIVGAGLLVGFAHLAMQLLKSVPTNTQEPSSFPAHQRALRLTRLYYLLVLAVYVVDWVSIQVLAQQDYYHFTRFFYNPFLIGIAVLTYTLGFFGYQQRAQPLVKIKREVDPGEYQQLQTISTDLIRLMERDKVYQNATLSLDDLAERLMVKPYLLTKTLKHIHQTTFSDFTNRYRIEDLKEQIMDPVNQKFTLIGLAYNAGFNSKSSFHRAVKKHYDLTPGELKERLLQEKED